jgi:type II secretion system protein H
LNARRRHPAFTLLELILVLLIITIVVGAVAPRLTGFTMGRSGKHTASRVLSMTNYARTQAISEGRPYRLNYSEKDRTFWLDFIDGSVPGSDLAARMDVDERLTITTTGMSTAGKGDQYIEFRPSGRLDPSSIVITDQAGAQIEVACTSSTELFRIVPESERVK